MNFKLNIILLLFSLFSVKMTFAQVLVDNPCSLPVGSEWTLNSGCINVSTAGMTPLFNPGSCNSGGFDDGWAWFTGDGNSITINFVADPGFDPVIHVFEHTAPCSVLEVACADNTLDGGTETITFTSTLGQAYLIRIQDWNTSNTMTGCLEVNSAIPVINLTDNPCGLPALSEWVPGAPCQATTTTGFTPLFDPVSCGSGAFNDGWAWYIGTGAANTITYTADPGVDITLHLFEADISSGCNVTELACANDNGAGGSESIVGGGLLGQLYFIRIQSVGSNAVATGCLEVIENPPSCDDGIQNGTETGIDCGGSCPNVCATSTCSNTTNSNVGLITCFDIGNAGFDALSTSLNFDGSVETGGPSPTTSCGPNWNGSGNFSSWGNFDLAPGVTSMQLDLDNRPISATADVFVAYYQGGNCGSLSEVGCELFIDFDAFSGDLIPQTVLASNLDPNLPLYVVLFSNSAFNLSATPRGFGGEPANTDCANAVNNSATGCNAGATGDLSFTPPDAFAAGTCSGGTWLSNENTVYYSFTPTSTNATLQIDNIICNNGTSGTAQFGVWESCADVGTYGTEFLGCVVGSGNLTLSGLTIGQTYTVVVDGNGGDVCQWEFIGTGILLPLEIVKFEAEYQNKIVNIDWRAIEDEEFLYYELERSENGIEFSSIARVDAMGKSGSMEYKQEDNAPLDGISYYRLKLVKVDGTTAYSDVISIEIAPKLTNDVALYPNPVVDEGNLYINTVKAADVQVEIVNMSGQIMFAQNYSLDAGNNKLIIEMKDLPSGVFYLSVGNEENKTNLKLVKK